MSAWQDWRERNRRQEREIETARRAKAPETYDTLDRLITIGDGYRKLEPDGWPYGRTLEGAAEIRMNRPGEWEKPVRLLFRSLTEPEAAALLRTLAGLRKGATE